MALVFGISISSTAAYAQAELTPEDANKAASDDDIIGWNPYVNLTGTVSLSDNQSVIGQVNGFGALFGLGVVAGADYVRDSHLFRTSLSINEGWARTPTISKFIKTNDNAKLDGQYNYFITKFFGAYGRLSLSTSIFQTEDVKPQSSTWVDSSDLSNVEVLKAHSDDFKLAGAFSPFTINESAGIFADPVRQGYFALSVRAGVGGRHTFANGDYVENGTQDATCANAGGPVDAGVPCVDLLKLSDVQQFGAELFAGANGKFDSNRATYKAGAAVLFPFVNNDSYHRSAAHLTRIAFEGQLAYTLSSWLSVVYNLQVIRDPELFPQGQEQVQVQNTVLLTFQYGLVKKKTKAKAPTKEQIELDAAKKRADAAERLDDAAGWLGHAGDRLGHGLGHACGRLGHAAGRLGQRLGDAVKRLALALVVLLWSAVAAADAGKTLAAVGGKCSVTIPVDWTTNGPLAMSPDKKVSIAVSQPKNVESIAALKQSVKTVYKDAKVTKDGPSELELEGKAVDGKPNVYRAIAGAKGLCVAEVRYETGTTDGALQLARTLRQ